MTHQNADDAYEAQLRSTTIEDCQAKGWILQLRCKACSHGAEVDPSEGGLPLKMTLAALGRSSKCSRCEGVGAWVDMRQGGTPTPDQPRSQP